MKLKSYLPDQAVTLLCVALLTTLGCGDDSAGFSAPLQELYDQGFTRYVGSFSPETSTDPDENRVRTHRFAVPDDPTQAPRGPLCLRGAEFTVDTREGDSDELVIFLQGGGACWEDFCAAFEESSSITASGILGTTVTDNPVATNDLVYVPYCDGSLFIGDVDRELPASAAGDLTAGPSFSYQRGLQNLSAALDIAVAEFPNPSRIVLAGVSGGAFGTIMAAPLVRFHYPNVDILVWNDSGIGVAKQDDPSFVEDLLAGWNASNVLPTSCVDCLADGHVTPVIEWNLDADPNLRIAAISHAQDSVIASFFLMIEGMDFQTSLLAETARMATNFPDRYKRFIIPGTAHTVLLNAGAPTDEGLSLGSLQTEINGTSVLEWITGMLNGDDTWVNLVDPSLE